jgi:hypothetical protein
VEIWNGGGGFSNSETFGNLEFGGGGVRVSESDLIFEKEGTCGYYTK